MDLINGDTIMLRRRRCATAPDTRSKDDKTPFRKTWRTDEDDGGERSEVPNRHPAKCLCRCQAEHLIFTMSWLIFVLSLGAVSLLMPIIRHGEISKVADMFYLVPPVTAPGVMLVTRGGVSKAMV